MTSQSSNSKQGALVLILNQREPNIEAQFDHIESFAWSFAGPATVPGDQLLSYRAPCCDRFKPGAPGSFPYSIVVSRASNACFDSNLL
jgi:hypothetical protein